MTVKQAAEHFGVTTQWIYKLIAGLENKGREGDSNHLSETALQYIADRCRNDDATLQTVGNSLHTVSKQEYNDLQSELDQARAENRKYQNQVEAMQEELTRVNDDLTAAQKKAGEADQRIKALQSSLDQAEKDRQAARDSAEQARNDYERISARANELQARIDDIAAERGRILSNLDKVTAETEQLRQELKAANEYKQAAEVLQVKLDSANKLLSKAEEEADFLKTTIIPRLPAPVEAQKVQKAENIPNIQDNKKKAHAQAEHGTKQEQTKKKGWFSGFFGKQ